MSKHPVSARGESAWTARDVMRTQVRTVDPGTSLADLERAFLDARVSGFPVVENGRLVGIVSRSDVVRQLSVERSQAETISDYYREMTGFSDPTESLGEIADRVGQRLGRLRVADLMIRSLITVTPDQPLAEVARVLLEHGIHRVPVTEGDRLVGIVTSLDLVRLFAEEKAKPA
jgi:CBS domain-containing protein